MSWTDAHAAVVAAFAAKYPCPGGEGQSEDARAWTRQLAEQFAFSFPSEGWGHKSAGGGRPPSTDVIATRSPFIGYDVIGGQGRPGWTLNLRPGSEVLTGQEFIPVTPTDWLGTTGTGTTPPPVVTMPAGGITEHQVRAIVRAELLRAEGELAWLRGCLQETTRALGEMRGLLEQQDRRREELAVHADEVLVERTKGWAFRANAKVIGTITGRVGE